MLPDEGQRSENLELYSYDAMSELSDQKTGLQPEALIVWPHQIKRHG